MESDARQEKHKGQTATLERKKVDGGIARATEDKGLLLVVTGEGKGKSTADLYGSPCSRARAESSRLPIHQGHLGMLANAICSPVTALNFPSWGPVCLGHPG